MDALHAETLRTGPSALLPRFPAYRVGASQTRGKRRSRVPTIRHTVSWLQGREAWGGHGLLSLSREGANGAPDLATDGSSTFLDAEDPLEALGCQFQRFRSHRFVTTDHTRRDHQVAC